MFSIMRASKDGHWHLEPHPLRLAEGGGHLRMTTAGYTAIIIQTV
jgi:hypothetical protein